jgi:hypothetical protein
LSRESLNDPRDTARATARERKLKNARGRRRNAKIRASGAIASNQRRIQSFLRGTAVPSATG